MGTTGTSAVKKSVMPAKKGVPARMCATPWGAAAVVDELRLPQRAGEKRFASVVQLLEIRDERLVRFAYSTDGPSGRTARRGPVTLRARDLERLRAELAKHPELGAALGLTGALGLGGGPEGGEA